ERFAAAHRARGADEGEPSTRPRPLLAITAGPRARERTAGPPSRPEDLGSSGAPEVKPLSAGSEIDSWCTKCRLYLGHRVVAMVAGAPKRVVCLTCGSEHNYRAAPADARAGVTVRSRSGGTASPKSTTTSARSQSRARAEQERYESWASRTLGRTVEAFSRYSMDRTFRAGELI